MQEEEKKTIDIDTSGPDVDVELPEEKTEEQKTIEKAQAPDEQMEENYVDFLIDEALSDDEEAMLMQELQANPQLSMLFDKVMEVNLKSVFNMTKACQRVFLKNRKGSIINMSSVVGVKGNAGQSNYAASKAGIIGFSKSIAQELGSRSIRCNVIAPGFIKTEMTDNLSDSIIESWTENIPLKRPGESNDVANLCLFLASDLSSYITGQVINVDGGLLT